MDAMGFETLRAQIIRALVEASPLSTTVRAWVRGLPAIDEDDAVAEWVATLDCVSDQIEDRVRGAGNSINAVRGWLRAYDLVGEALKLLAEPLKASCDGCGGFSCSACDGRGVVFDGRAA